MNAPGQRSASGFTLLELLVVMTIVAILATLSVQGISRMRAVAQGATCANSLRQLGMANSLYLSEHENKMYAYSQVVTGGRLWYFGYETQGSMMSAEGDRYIDVTKSPLYPYVHQVGGVEVCPAFPYGQAIWKPKYDRASWGFGLNTMIANKNVLTIKDPSQVILFGDCAQVNTFQAPASAHHPMIEEFYMIDSNDPTIHFRHGGYANILFLDGHVEKFTMYPGTLDTRLPSVEVGRITPLYSMQYLQ